MAWRFLPARRMPRCRGGRPAGRKLTAIVAAVAMVTSLVIPVAAQNDPPARPTGLRLSAPSHELVRLTWRNPGDSSITGYRILRRLADYTTSFGEIDTVTGSNVTSYEDDSVVAGTTYYYSIKAVNSAGDSEESDGMFGLYIRVPAVPINDSPVVTGSTAVNFTENGTKTVARYRARDPDSNQFTWDLEGEDEDDFSITDGVLAFRSPPDFENPTDRGAGSGDNDYEVTVRALDDDSAVGELDVVVSVVGVNEPPTFTAGDTAVSYTEDGTGIVQTYLAMDPEGKEISWSLSGTDRGDFTIAGGELNFVAPPDFDAPTDSNRNNEYVVTVVASDGAKTSTRSVTVTVEDVDELGAVTLSSPQPMVDIDLTATLSDPDGRITSIEWRWDSQEGGTGPWVLISSANSARFRPRASDAGDRLRVEVRYDDRSGSKSLTSAETRVVQPLRSNNLRPVFASQSFTYAVAENTSSGQNVGDPVEATDEDVSSLVYSLSGTDAAAFTVDSSSGQIATSVPLDYETKRTYGVNVVATDSSGVSQSVAVTINVEDVEELLSAVTGDTPVEYAEDRTDAVATYTATDPDGTAVTWSLSGVDAGRFDISNRGVLSLAIRPDFDDPADQGGNNTYDVTVEASSGGDDSSLPVMVMVTDIDEPLVLTGDGSVRFAENRSSSETVHTYEADDPEGEAVVWTLEGADRELFTIVGGELKFEASPDHENPTDRGTNGSYDVTVVASDKRHTAERDVTVAVTDVDEPATLTFSSQQPQAGTALTARLTDPDARIRVSSWRWHKSPTGTDPWLDATGRGARSAKYTPGEGAAPPDGDEGLYLRVSVTYADAFGSKALELITTRTVRAEPPTNSPPVFSSTDGRRSISEDAAPGQDIGAAFSATDTDTGDTSLSYSLAGTDADSFDIDASTGQLTTRAALDYEAKSSYEVTVRVTDPSNAFDDVAVTVGVENVEENGTVTLSGVPPEVGTRLTATLTDPDGDISDLGWQWQRSTSRDGVWTDIFAATSQTYTPTGAHTDYDTDYYLRAVASYKDGSSPNTLETADGTTLEIVERVQQQQRDTSTDTDDDDDDDRSTSSGGSSGTSSGGGTGVTQRPDPEPEPEDEIFSDIADTPSVHRRAVQTLSDEGVLDGTGCGRGRLCPQDHLLRWEMAVWLTRVVDDGVDPLPTGKSRFSDVDADEWWSPHVERLANLGITEGCTTEPLSYCPDEPVTRAQMASFLVRAFELPRAGSAGFEDTAGNVHARNIDAIYAAEITIGCATIPLTYCPDQSVTRAQMASFLIRGR